MTYDPADDEHGDREEALAGASLPGPSRRRRLTKVAGWLVGIAAALVILNVLGVDVVGWVEDLWDEIKAVPVGYILAGLTFQTGVTVLAGVSYYGILSAAYPGEVTLLRS